jgi:hypothetical protein
VQQVEPKNKLNTSTANNISDFDISEQEDLSKSEASTFKRQLKQRTPLAQKLGVIV